MKRNPWSTLAVLAVAQFIVTLDITIVNVALPHIQSGLGFSADNLQWVISAYTLLFGGFLLLGGRAADMLGRRRFFMVGLLLFGVASLAGGFATSPGLLIAMRALQGLGGALLSPAALSILTVTFAHGRQRNLAMGIWGGLAGLGGTLGVIAGGVLVDALSWRWVFFVNVPFVAILLMLTPLFVPESRAPQQKTSSFDVAGAVLSTSGLLLIVYAVVRAGVLGWGSHQVELLLVVGLALLAVFVVVESRSKEPLIPLSIFRSRSMTTASGVLALNGAVFLAMFFLTAIYLQEVRGDSALEAGIQFLPMGIAAIAAAVAASQLVTRIGTRWVQLGGSVVSVLGLWLLSRVGADGSYVGQVMPGIILFGVGIIGVGVPGQITAVADFTPEAAGTASGVVSAFYQIGGAIGLAVVTALSNARVTSVLRQGATPRVALLDGFHRGLLVATAFGAMTLLLTLASPQIRPSSEELKTLAAVA
jgi:EmrB/QacA subfamily drug resistance transporter